MTTLGKAQLRRIHVANSHELCCLSLSEVARKVRTPIAIPYHTYAYYVVPHSIASCQTGGKRDATCPPGAIPFTVWNRLYALVIVQVHYQGPVETGPSL